jgi:hypothetical protein
MRLLEGLKGTDGETVAICPDAIEYLISSDEQTWIYFDSGDSVLVDHTIKEVCETLRKMG